MSNIKLKDLKVGQVFVTNQGGSCTVTSISDYRNIGIEHNDKYKHTMTVRLQRLNKGEVNNPYFPTLLGVGFQGKGQYSPVIDKVAYKMWSAMMTRAYCSKTKTRQPSYTGVTVCEEWHNFQNFAEWFYELGGYSKGFQLDKDIVQKGNKLYSPNTCVLVPQEINKLFIVRGGNGSPTGVYRRKGRYEVKAGQKYVGIYSCESEAIQAYHTAKSGNILSILSKWQDKVSPLVVSKLKLLATEKGSVMYA